MLPRCRVLLPALLWWAAGACHAHAPLRPALPAIPSTATAHLALALNLFEPAGLPGAVLVPCANGNQCMERLERGEAGIAQARWAQARAILPAAAGEPDFLQWLRPGPLRALDARRVSVAR